MHAPAVARREEVTALESALEATVKAVDAAEARAGQAERRAAVTQDALKARPEIARASGLRFA